jgi:hypothetical protein
MAKLKETNRQLSHAMISVSEVVLTRPNVGYGRIDRRSCPGCRHSPTNQKGNPVSSYHIKNLMQRFQPLMTELEAAMRVAGFYPQECDKCDYSTACNNSGVYLRLDAAAPPIQYAQTHYLSRIPRDKHRIPALELARTHNWTDIFRYHTTPISSQTLLAGFQFQHYHHPQKLCHSQGDSSQIRKRSTGRLHSILSSGIPAELFCAGP